MREFFQRHRASLLGFFALVLPLFLLYVHGRSPRPTTVVEVGLMRVTAPVQSAASQMLTGVVDLWSGYLALVDLQAENAGLEDQNRVLTAEALHAKELGLENQRLRALLDFKRVRKDLKTVAAHIIGKDVSTYAQVVRVAVDVGADDAVREGMPVVSSEGLVGRIRRVAGRYAEVMLTTDPRSAVNVKVAGKGISGTVQGKRTSTVYAARLLFLNEEEALATRDTLVTSGHDKVFPPGIEVGYVGSLEKRQVGVYYELEVAPAVSFSTLEEVLVVTGVVDADMGTDDGGTR